MSTIASNKWIDTLEARTRALASTVAGWTALPEVQLQHPPAPGAWSAAECLAHLNAYGNYYLPAIQEALQRSQPPAVADFKPGWFGAWFTNWLEPDEEGIPRSKAKAPKDYRPVEVDAHAELALFAAQQATMLQLLEQARGVNLGKVRVPMSVSPLLRLKLGDTLAFTVAHICRHVRQAERALASAAAVKVV